MKIVSSIIQISIRINRDLCVFHPLPLLLSCLLLMLLPIILLSLCRITGNWKEHGNRSRISGILNLHVSGICLSVGGHHSPIIIHSGRKSATGNALRRPIYLSRASSSLIHPCNLRPPDSTFIVSLSSAVTVSRGIIAIMDEIRISWMVAEKTSFRGFFYLLPEEYTSDNNKRITYKPIDNKIICRALVLVRAMIS